MLKLLSIFAKHWLFDRKYEGTSEARRPLQCLQHPRRIYKGFSLWVLGYVPLFLLPGDIGSGWGGVGGLRDQESENEPERRRRGRLRVEWISLAALARGYSLCCYGNSREEGGRGGEEGSVSVCWGGYAGVCEPTSGPGWDHASGASEFGSQPVEA